MHKHCPHEDIAPPKNLRDLSLAIPVIETIQSINQGMHSGDINIEQERYDNPKYSPNHVSVSFFVRLIRAASF